MSRRAALGFAAVVITAAIAVAVLIGFGITSDPAHTPALPRSSTPAAPASTLTRIALAGDTGTGPGGAIDATVAAMVAEGRRRSYDGLVLLGDLIYPDGEADQTGATITDVFSPLTSRGTQLVPVLGNHDYMSGEQAMILDRLGRGAQTWYAEQVGIIRIVVLDTEQVDDTAQLIWLQKTLASTNDAAWTVVAMHKPAYSAGSHGSDQEIQQRWVPIFERYDVPLVFAGHDHDYQRPEPINGVTYVVSGGAATLRPSERDNFTEVSTSTLHFVDLLAEDDRLTVRAIDQSGKLFDSVELTR